MVCVLESHLAQDTCPRQTVCHAFLCLLRVRSCCRILLQLILCLLLLIFCLRSGCVTYAGAGEAHSQLPKSWQANSCRNDASQLWSALFLLVLPSPHFASCANN